MKPVNIINLPMSPDQRKREFERNRRMMNERRKNIGDKHSTEFYERLKEKIDETIKG